MALYSDGLYSDGRYSYGLYSYGLYSDGRTASRSGRAPHRRLSLPRCCRTSSPAQGQHCLCRHLLRSTLLRPTVGPIACARRRAGTAMLDRRRFWSKTYRPIRNPTSMLVRFGCCWKAMRASRSLLEPACFQGSKPMCAGRSCDDVCWPHDR